MPKERLEQEVENFKLYKSQLPVVEQAISRPQP